MKVDPSTLVLAVITLLGVSMGGYGWMLLIAGGA